MCRIFFWELDTTTETSTTTITKTITTITTTTVKTTTTTTATRTTTTTTTTVAMVELVAADGYCLNITRLVVDNGIELSKRGINITPGNIPNISSIKSILDHNTWRRLRSHRRSGYGGQYQAAEFYQKILGILEDCKYLNENVYELLEYYYLANQGDLHRSEAPANRQKTNPITDPKAQPKNIRKNTKRIIQKIIQKIIQSIIEKEMTKEPKYKEDNLVNELRKGKPTIR